MTMLSISARFVGLTLVAARAVAQNTAEECFADGYVNPCMGFAMDCQSINMELRLP